ncbi:MAG: hypothetical protein RBU24_00830 [Kiritimatiellia bacterium]|jgi:hypothetical protein|nr:hypothetical protein [Kiritimatiellia bacterium]
MKKYNTRPIDFTGCHPVIAEALKRHEDIKCRVWDSDCDRGREVERWICRYKGNSNFPYFSDSGIPWRYAEPTPLKTRRIMPPERAIPVLIAEGWEFDDNGDLVGYGNSVLITMFKLMGKPLSDQKVSVWAWPPCIIEEVEDDE